MNKHIILFLAANPLGTTELALGREARAIQEELERSGQRDKFEFVTRWAAQPLDLIRELRKLKPMVVHFSGHGGRGGRQQGAEARRDIEAELGGDSGTDDSEGDGGLCFQGPDGRPQLVTAAGLRETFGAVEASVKLVVLNACYSDIHAEALLAHIDCVVGMRGSLRDDAARAFAIGFYGGLGERQSVAAAYLQGCAAISLEQPPDNARPQLRARNGVAADQLVLAEADVVGRGRPIPAYPNAEVEQLSKRLDDARARRDKLRGAGISANHLDREILELRRQLREGGQLRAGDALSEGRYLLVKVVGQGGFAVVWEAYDCAAQQRVAIKVLHTNLGGDPLRRERFFRGAQAMMRLAHPAVVRVLEPKGEDGGFYYFVMEYVPGGNLREAVLGRRIQNEDVLPLIFQIGEVLVLAHSQGMIHRDIKPANILLDQYGQAKLTDFDLVGAHDTTGGTRTGALGTVVYAAPECLEKPQEATARADVYSLGMTLIFCLSGKELSLSTFKNPDPTIAMLQCSNRIREVLRRAVTWEPSARFENAREFMAELQRAMGQHLADDVRGSAQGEMGEELGTHFGPVSHASEQRDWLPRPELGHSTQWGSLAASLDRLLSSILVHGAIVSVFAGLGIALAMFGVLLIEQGIHAGFIAELVVASGMMCTGLGLSVVYIAARSVSERMQVLAAVSHRGSRFRSRATVVAIVAGVGLVATVLIAVLASSWRVGP